MARSPMIFPWSLVPEKKLTVEDVKYVLSTHYQGTPYDPYTSRGDLSERGKYRAVGINRNDFVAVIQMRPDQPEDAAVIQWLAFASNAFNVLVPFTRGFLRHRSIWPTLQKRFPPITSTGTAV